MEKRQHWEYLKVESMDIKEIESALCKAGADGWELVAILEDKGEAKMNGKRDFYYHQQLIFKRPLNG